MLYSLAVSAGFGPASGSASTATQLIRLAQSATLPTHRIRVPVVPKWATGFLV